MKKILVLLICAIVLSGCNSKKEENISIEDNNAYEIENSNSQKEDTQYNLDIIKDIEEIVKEEVVIANPITIDDLKPGDILSKEEIDKKEEWFKIYQINNNDEIYNRIKDKSYIDNNNISLNELRYIKLLHYNFDHKIQVGELIVNAEISDVIMDIFIELFENEYEIQSMYLIDNYWQGNGEDTDTASIEENNSSAFCYREITNGKKLSNHAFGKAIDINPQQNPYVSYKTGKAVWYHENADEYIDRSSGKEHMIDENDTCYLIFIKHGFSWGGNWNTIKDYQHFEFD